MAKFRTSGKMKKSGIVKLKIVVEKIHKSLLMGRTSSSYCDDNVPEDVREGHFAVIAVDAAQPKRFVIPLSYLTYPRFLMLLDKAAEEYGFDNDGALTIPCRPCELESILAERWQQVEAAGGMNRGPMKQWYKVIETLGFSVGFIFFLVVGLSCKLYSWFCF